MHGRCASPSAHLIYKLIVLDEPSQCFAVIAAAFSREPDDHRLYICQHAVTACHMQHTMHGMACKQVLCEALHCSSTNTVRNRRIY